MRKIGDLPSLKTTSLKNRRIEIGEPFATFSQTFGNFDRQKWLTRLFSCLVGLGVSCFESFCFGFGLKRDEVRVSCFLVP